MRQVPVPAKPGDLGKIYSCLSVIFVEKAELDSFCHL
jgi:hypothetical protein